MRKGTYKLITTVISHGVVFLITVYFSFQVFRVTSYDLGYEDARQAFTTKIESYQDKVQEARDAADAARQEREEAIAVAEEKTAEAERATADRDSTHRDLVEAKGEIRDLAKAVKALQAGSDSLSQALGAEKRLTDSLATELANSNALLQRLKATVRLRNHRLVEQNITITKLDSTIASDEQVTLEANTVVSREFSYRFGFYAVLEAFLLFIVAVHKRWIRLTRNVRPSGPKRPPRNERWPCGAQKSN